MKYKFLFCLLLSFLALHSRGAALQSDNFTIDRGEEFTSSVNINIEDAPLDGYSGFQFDIVLPTDFSVTGVQLGGGMNNFSISSKTLPDGRVRVIGYTNGDNLTTAVRNIVGITYTTSSTTPAGPQTVSYTNVFFSTPDGGDVFFNNSSFQITVRIPAKEIQLNAYNLTLMVGTTDRLEATVLPADAEMKNVTWNSNDLSIASVSADGTVTAIAAGSTTVTATCGEATATCTVTVKGTDGITVNPGDGTHEDEDDDNPGGNTENGGSLTGNDLTLRVNQTAAIEIGLPDGLDVTPTLVWTLENNGAEFVSMTVSQNTLSASFRGLKVGQTGYTVSISSADGNIEAVSGKITVIAETPLSSLRLEPADVTMAKNALPVTLTPIYTPQEDTMPALSWSSDNTAVAVVDDNGKVTPVGEGSCLITANATDGSMLSATCRVTVTAPIDGGFQFEFDDSVMGGIEGVTIYLGDSFTITPKAQEGYDLPENITWNSSDITKVTVDPKGNVTGVGLGEATVTASAVVNGETVAASCKVIVIPIPASEITLSADDLTLLVGTTDRLTATVEPDNTTFPDITWSSQNEDIAKVSADGTVTAIAAGSTTVTATCGEATASCTVTVKGTGGITVNPGDGTHEDEDDDDPGGNTENGGSLTGNDLTLRVNQTGAIEIGLPEGLDVTPTLVWTLENNGADLVSMTVSQNTLSASFRGLKVGQTGYTVSIESADGNIEAVSGKITVIAETPLSSLRLDPEEVTMAKNALPVTLTPIYTPQNATMPALSWSSDNTAVAVVDDNGKVTPVGEGSCLITANATDGSMLSATCRVTVTAPIDGGFQLEFDDSVMGGIEGVTIYLGDSFTITPKAQEGYDLPENITWNSSDITKVTVDPKGNVTGVGLGEATVTASAVVNGESVAASCKVIVIPIPASEITLSADDLTLLVGTTDRLTATVEPDNTTFPDITWSSQNEDIAKVSADGTVTAIAAGSTTVTATCGEATATCTVTVKGTGGITVNPGDGTHEDEDDDNPGGNTENGGSLTGNDLTLRVNQTAAIEIGLPEGLDVTPTLIWTLENNGAELVSMTVSQNTLSASFRGLKVGKTGYTVSISSANGNIEAVSGKITVIPSFIPDEPSIPTNPGDDGNGEDKDEMGWYGNHNGTYVSALRIREGNTIGMRVNEAEGGYPDAWTYIWSFENETIGEGEEIETPAELASEAQGRDEMTVSQNSYLVNVTNYGPENEIFYQVELSTRAVDVYKRPATPSELLRKGDGTSCTFVVMMDKLDDDQLAKLGYNFVYGYTDSEGNDHILDNTTERYTYTIPEIYNNTANRFWAYSFWIYADGSVISSGLRNLDGSADENFDASSFEGYIPTRSSSIGVVTGIYTVEGQFVGKDLDRIGSGIYIVKTTKGSYKIIR